MPKLEMFEDYLADMITAGHLSMDASDIGSLIALAFMESNGDWTATIDALNRAANELNEFPAVAQALEVLRGAVSQISTGGWADR